MENIKVEKSEKQNVGLEKLFEQDFIKNILSKLYGLDESGKKDLENFVGAEFDEKEKTFYLSDQHKNAVAGLEKLVSKKMQKSLNIEK